MDLKFTDEQRMLRETTRDLCVSHCGVDVVRKMENDPLGVPQALWQNMQEMGLLGILLPQDLGGMGLNMLDCAVIYEEFGRALVPGPHFGSAVMSVLAIRHAGTNRTTATDRRVCASVRRARLVAIGSTASSAMSSMPRRHTSCSCWREPGRQPRTSISSSSTRIRRV